MTQHESPQIAGGPIIVTDYNPIWPQWFAELSGRTWPEVADVALRIDHVGSTAVTGLAAKPIIDMDIVVRSSTEVPLVVASLTEAGYRWDGDLGVEGREAFSSPGEHQWPRHHLYLVVDGNRAHMDHILLRDLLRSDPVACRRYEQLKRTNAALADGDLDYYVAAKAGLVAELLTRARLERGLAPVTYWVPDLETPDAARSARTE